MKMVYIFCPVMRYGGVEFLALNLAIGFKSKGMNVSVITLDNEGDFISNFRNKDINVIFSKNKNIFMKLISLRKEVGDSMILFMPSNYSYLSSIFFRGKKIIIIDNLNDFIFRGSLYSDFLKLIKIIQINFVFDIVIYSYFKAKYSVSKKIFYKVKQKVIYHPISKGIDSNLTVCSSHESDFIYLGRLEPEKGVMILLKSFDYLKKSYGITPNLKILGDGSLLQQMVDFINKNDLKNIKMEGFVKNPANYIYNAKFLILPSLNEGCSGVVKESIFLGVPAIVSNVSSGGPQEMIGEGRFGEIFECGDFKSLANCVLRVSAYNHSKNKYDYDFQKNMYRKLKMDNAISEYMSLIDRCE